MKIQIFGVSLHAVTRTEVFEQALKLLHGVNPSVIATPNAEILLCARKNAAFREALNASALAIPDGTGPVAAARLAGAKTERIPGVDFAADLITHAASHGEKVTIVGGKPGQAQAAAEKLTEKHPGLVIHAEPTSGAFQVRRDGTAAVAHREQEILERLRGFGTQILLAAFGAPKQELWIRRVLPHVPTVRIAMGIGGGVDYWAGTVPRAPKVLQKSGLEWLWRVVLEPWRLPRILNAIVAFPTLFLAEKLKGALRSLLLRL